MLRLHHWLESLRHLLELPSDPISSPGRTKSESGWIRYLASQICLDLKNFNATMNYIP